MSPVFYAQRANLVLSGNTQAKTFRVLHIKLSILITCKVRQRLIETITPSRCPDQHFCVAVQTSGIGELSFKHSIQVLRVIHNKVNEAKLHGNRHVNLLPREHEPPASVLRQPLLCCKRDHARNQPSLYFWEGEGRLVLRDDNVGHAWKDHASPVSASMANDHDWKSVRQHCTVELPKEYQAPHEVFHFRHFCSETEVFPRCLQKDWLLRGSKDVIEFFKHINSKRIVGIWVIQNHSKNLTINADHLVIISIPNQKRGGARNILE